MVSGTAEVVSKTYGGKYPLTKLLLKLKYLARQNSQQPTYSTQCIHIVLQYIHIYRLPSMKHSSRLCSRFTQQTAYKQAKSLSEFLIMYNIQYFILPCVVLFYLMFYMYMQGDSVMTTGLGEQRHFHTVHSHSERSKGTVDI